MFLILCVCVALFFFLFPASPSTFSTLPLLSLSLSLSLSLFLVPVEQKGWRAPHGIDGRFRRRFKGQQKHAKIGFGSNKKVRVDTFKPSLAEGGCGDFFLGGGGQAEEGGGYGSRACVAVLSHAHSLPPPPLSLVSFCCL